MESTPLLPSSASHSNVPYASVIGGGSIVHPPSTRTPGSLSPRDAQRLAQLKAKAALAEVQEEKEAKDAENLRRQGIIAPPIERKIIHHRVMAGDDLTDLAVKFGSSV